MWIDLTQEVEDIFSRLSGCLDFESRMHLSTVSTAPNVRSAQWKKEHPERAKATQRKTDQRPERKEAKRVAAKEKRRAHLKPKRTAEEKYEAKKAYDRAWRRVNNARLAANAA